jgi:hypothetical protein
MLTGTSHPSEEVIFRYSRSATTGEDTKSTTPVTFYANGWSTTVEKVAVVSVMAGCKPEYMPVCLAIASFGGGLPSSNGLFNCFTVVSGPYAKEIGMNSGAGAWNPGNPPNSTIGRLNGLMVINFGGAINGMTRTDFGSPWNRGTAWAEDDEALPGEGDSKWLPVRQEVGFREEESAVSVVWALGSVSQTQFAPSSFRALIAQGSGGMARRIGVEGQPGPHNFLEYVIPIIILDKRSTWTFIMHPAMAQSLYDYGFKSKQAVYDWVTQAGMIPVEQYRNEGWFDHETNSGTNKEPTSGIAYNDLPPNYQITGVRCNCILVGMAPGDDTCIEMRQGRGTYRGIDIWR